MPTEVVRWSLALNQEVLTYRWSRDGGRIAFGTDRCDGDYCQGTSHLLWVMRADGGNPSLLTDDGGTPTWSPDGRKLAFADDYLYTINSDGIGAPEQLSDQAFVWDDSHTWSPDGEFIAFEGWSPDDGAGIYVIHPDGTGLVNLSRGRIGDGVPVWSPDGRRLVFSTGSLEERSIAVMNRDGSGLTLSQAGDGVVIPDGPLTVVRSCFREQGVRAGLSLLS